MAEIEVNKNNRDELVKSHDSVSSDEGNKNGDLLAPKKKDKKKKHDGESEHKGVITKETLVPEAVLVQAFTQAEYYLELQYPINATVEGPIDIVWTPATGALDVEFKTGSKVNESVGVTKALTPSKKKEHSHGAHYKLKYDNIVVEIGINPEDLPYSFVSGRDADPFVRFINGTLYIRLALEEITMAQAVVHMNVNEVKKGGMKLEAKHKDKTNKDLKSSHDSDQLERLTTEQALMDM